MKKGMVGFLSLVTGAATGAVAVSRLKDSVITQKENKIDKFKSYYNMLNQWLILKQQGESLVKFFEENDYKTIAIYGMGEMGNRLYDELKESQIVVKYAIDEAAGNKFSELKVISPEDDFEDVDAIIITATFAYDEICEKLESKTSIQLISLDDVVYGA